MKTITHPSQFTVRLFAFLLCLFFLISCKNEEANATIITDDPIAYAYPIDKITLDGELEDWPIEMGRYPIKNAELGDKPSGSDDYKGHFRIGYNLEQNAVYIALETTDQSTIIDSTDNGNWDTQDGLELYVIHKDLQSNSPVTQYSEYGDNRLAFGASDTWENVEMKKNVTSKGMIAEWKITLDQKIKIGTSIRMDLVVIDKDADDSFTWISWGKGTQKVANPDRCGNVLFVAPDTELALLEGKVDTSELPSQSIPLTVKLSQVDNPELWVQTTIDSLGKFKAPLPLGEYQITLPTKLIQIENNFHRIAPSDPITFVLDKGGLDTSPTLKPKVLPRPDLIPEKGLLQDFGKEQQNQVDQFITTYQEYYNIPGVSLALINDGKVVYHKTYGVKNTTTKEPVDEMTLFEAASITKPVFAFVILRLADKGIIDLDRPLHQYLPFEALEAYPEHKKMTARHVLIHRSGLPNWGTEMINVPGEKYGYSGEGFEYLKRVVVKITGKGIEQVLDEELINPYGLYHMEFSDSEELRKVVSSGHVGNVPTGWGIPQEAGMAFSMHTEAKAFSKYAHTLLEEKGLKPSTYKDYMTIHTESNTEYWNEPDNREGAGLGIFVRESDYGDTFFHGGNNGDFMCAFEVYKDLKMGYACFTNSETGNVLGADLWRLLVEGRKGNE